MAAAAAAAARRHYRGLTWLGRARRAGGAPGVIILVFKTISHQLNFIQSVIFYSFTFYITEAKILYIQLFEKLEFFRLSGLNIRILFLNSFYYYI